MFFVIFIFQLAEKPAMAPNFTVQMQMDFHQTGVIK